MSNLLQRDFSSHPVRLDISRSTLPLDNHYLNTVNAGELRVCYFEEVLPGDSFNVHTGVNIRMSTPIHPVMDSAKASIEFFYVPWRLTWQHFEEFLGVNKDTFWTQPTTYTLPYLTAPTGGWAEGTLADDFGLPINVGGITACALPFRAYGLIYNYFWRNKNLMTAAGVNIDDTNRTGSNGSNYITDVQLGGMPAKACKLPDLYTRALPAPQKGAAVTLPLGTAAPVFSGARHPLNSSPEGITFKDIAGGNIWAPSVTANLGVSSGSDGAAMVGIGGLGGSTYVKVSPDNLYTDLSQATAATVNQLRLSFATQRILEAQARAGCSYQELLYGLYGTNGGDARLQMPEFLGGATVDIAMSQVLQTSSTDSTSPQGNTAAYSQTLSKEPHFVKSFVEHGCIIGLLTIRNKNSYQYGIPKFFSKRSRYDIYWPQLANIGEVGIKNSEIYAQGNSTDDGIFGYQEAWYEYRYHPNSVHGSFRSNSAAPLDSWHYADDYASLPTLGSTFAQSSSANIGRTLAVPGKDQFLVDLYFKVKATRPMPLYSVPGLIDHH